MVKKKRSFKKLEEYARNVKIIELKKRVPAEELVDLLLERIDISYIDDILSRLHIPGH